MAKLGARDFKPAGNMVGNQNFYVKDNKAYTEDNVLVQNIFVYNIPRKLTDEDISNYFNKFGHLLNVRVMKDKKRRRRTVPKVAFVIFANAEHARNVLQKTRHFLHNTHISVKAGDSWNQPKADKASSTVRKNNNITNIPAGFHILAMNDDCLEIICNLLMLSDQVRFARVCRRFQDIFKNICKREFKIFHLEKIIRLTLWETRDFLRLAGEYIECIIGNIPYENRIRIIEYICLSCPNMLRIAFDNIKLRAGTIKKLVSSFPKLRELSLSDCSVNDLALEPVRSLRDLKSLSLYRCYDINGKYLMEFMRLEELSINGCKEIMISNVIGLCMTLRNLRVLDIRHYLRINEEFITALTTHCTKLEVLKMSTPDVYYDKIARMPRLKHLELLYHVRSNSIQSRLFSSLAWHKADQLEVLKLAANKSLTVEQISCISELKNLKTLYTTRTNSINDSALMEFSKLKQLEELNVRGCDVTDSGVMTMLKKCTKLRHINVQSCRQITEKLVYDAIEYLNKNDDRKLPLIIYIYGTSIHSRFLSQTYKEAVKKSLIVLDESATEVLEDIDIDEADWLDEDDDFNDEDDYFNFSDSDIDDELDHFFNMAYDMFGQIHPHGFYINDVIW